MPALETLHGTHVVADPSALDAATWRGGQPEVPVTVLRFAADEAFVIGTRPADVDVADPDAIVVDEDGFVGAWCSIDDIGHHVEWSITGDGPALLQGSIAGVPAKLWLPGGAAMLLVTPAPYARELAERLGWTA